MPGVFFRWRHRLLTFSCPLLKLSFGGIVLVLAIVPYLVQAQLAAPAKPSEPAPAQSLAPPISPAQKSLFDSGKSLLEAGKHQEAADVFQQLIETFPRSPLVPQAYLLLGQAFSSMQKWEEANKSFRRLLDEFPTSDFHPEALVGL